MKPQQRRQLPTRLFNLRLVEGDHSDTIVVFCGDMVQPSYTPLFDANDRLVGIFFTPLKQCLFSRRAFTAEEDKCSAKWPRELLFLDRAKIIHFYQTNDVFALLLSLNAKSAGLIDPMRDARPLWERPHWNVDPQLSNTDLWIAQVEDRLTRLKQGSAKATVDGADNMAFFGIVLAAVASLVPGNDTDLFFQLSRMDEIIDMEAGSWLSQSINYAYQFRVGFADTITDYPHKDFLTEPLVVRIAVPEYLQFLHGTKAPFHFGKTYIGIKAFAPFARRMFVFGWKKWAIQIFRKLNASVDWDPALVEFMARTRLVHVSPFGKPLLVSTPALILPTVSPFAPACLQKLFSNSGNGRNLKHYARWQLAELAVDLEWTKFTVLNLVKPENRSEIGAAMDGYRRKGRTKNRCQIYMRSTDLCPYSPSTFRNCCAEISDIEDLSPGVSMQYRILRGGVD